MMTFNKYALPSLLILSGALAGCGGGGGSGDDNAIVNENELVPNELIPTETQTPDSSTQTPVGPFVPLEVTRNLADTADNTSLYANSNNSARLTGPVFGSGETDTIDLPKAIEFNTLNDGSGISIEGAFVHREVAFGEFFSNDAGVILVLRNSSTLVQCGLVAGITVRLDDGSYFENDGEVMEYNSRTFGSTYVNESDTGDLYRHGCIGPGDMVYAHFDTGALIRSGAPLEQVSGVDFAQARWSGKTYDSLVETLIVPLSYTFNEEEKNIEVVAVNQTNTPIAVSGAYVVALDSNGIPISHDFDLDLENPIYDVGETFTVLVDSQIVKGSSSTMRVVIDVGRRVLN